MISNSQKKKRIQSITKRIVENVNKEYILAKNITLSTQLWRTRSDANNVGKLYSSLLPLLKFYHLHQRFLNIEATFIVAMSWSFTNVISGFLW